MVVRMNGKVLSESPPSYTYTLQLDVEKKKYHFLRISSTNLGRIHCNEDATLIAFDVGRDEVEIMERIC